MAETIGRIASRVLGLLLLAGLLHGCGTTHSPPGASAHDLTDDQRRLTVVRTATAMIGKPYRYGGMRPDQGFDCSGLVHFSHNQAGIRVPRTAAQQLLRSKNIGYEELQPGDLLFFRITDKPSHVTIYLGDGEFVHAPSSGGRVRTENLATPYWRNRLFGAGSYF
ncbi:MAG: C40 family peptidase [Sedimenticola sp.]